MATPAVAGASALIRQYFTDGFYPTGSPSVAHKLTPSGALMKAMLANSAVPLRGKIDLKNDGRFRYYFLYVVSCAFHVQSR